MGIPKVIQGQQDKDAFGVGGRRDNPTIKGGPHSWSRPRRHCHKSRILGRAASEWSVHWHYSCLQHSQLKSRWTQSPTGQSILARTGVTAAYKQLTEKASLASPFLNTQSLDLDAYVTGKAMDGLFIMVAAEEKSIRKNPVARTTDLLKSVFGTLQK